MPRWNKTSSPSRRCRKTLTVEPLEARNLLAGVIFNELHYDPVDSSARHEFLELYNNSPATVDLSNWTIDKGVDYTFPAGSSIEAGQHLVIAQNANDFQSRFGTTAFGEWEDGDRLSNDGERIELLDASGTVVDELRYELGFPWPTPASGESIELINPDFDNSEGGAWRSVSGAGSFIAPNSSWSYRKGINNNPPADWNDVGFDTGTDNVAWQTGTTSIGYGDGDDLTILSDMQNGYTSVYFRKDFELAGAIPASLAMRLYVDDGAIIYVNGTEITREHVSGGTKDYNSTSGQSHEAEWEDVQLTGLSNILVSGTNTLAIHALNQAITSSDFSFDVELLSGAAAVTPGLPNSSFAINSPPFISDVEHAIGKPQSGQSMLITAEISDTDGVAGATLEYQLVNPGDYIAIDDPRYNTDWVAIPMTDNGTGGDAVVGDGVFSATLPGNLQTHRRLIRYRVSATDSLSASVQVPYADDPTPNFAYYVYDQTPDWTGAVQPGVTPEVTYSGETLDSVATYQLITTRQDHVDSQHIPGSTTSAYRGSDYLWDGALVYDGEVYDHIRYRARGGVWRYAMGKNMWKFDFNKGRDFLAKDAYGNEYDVGWRRLNLGANIQQRNFWHRGEQGLFETAGFKLFDLAGVEAPNTNYVQFRIVEDASESGPDQYSTDFQGLYLAVEQLDGRFLDQHGLPDGNLYKMENGTGVGGIGGDSNNQGDYPEVNDSSDLIDFKTTYESGSQTAEWWDDNFNLESYYSYRSIVESIHHYDIANGKNYFFYHNPETDKWQTVPWDLDLTWADNTFGSGNEPFKSRVLSIPEYSVEYRNRMREIRDLLYNNDQADAVIDEAAAFVYAPGVASLVDADRAMWDYNPILVSSFVDSSKAGHGQFYAGGPGVPATDDFAGSIQKLKDYVTTRGNWIDSNILTDDSQLPATPSIFYSGGLNFPVDQLEFRTTDFSDPNGDQFAAMEWRIGEVANPSVPGFDATQPWKYEIDATWESGELTTFSNVVQVTSAEISQGKTYRARVRVKDSAGHWSHWSAPREFVATAPAETTLAVTELHYHPDNPALANENDQEFIEILNTGTETLDLTGVQIADFASTPYIFPPGQMIQPGQYLVVPRTPAIFSQVYGSAIPTTETGYASRNLGNAGDSISIIDADGTQLLSFTYDDATPWPTAPDGSGPSLEIIDPFGDHADPANWQASENSGGSPGMPNGSFLPGDYDRNGVVEDADRLEWIAQFGTQVLNVGDGADGNRDRIVDAADFTIWRDNLGAVESPTSSSIPTSFDVPVIADAATAEAVISGLQVAEITKSRKPLLSDVALATWNYDPAGVDHHPTRHHAQERLMETIFADL